MQLKKHWIFYLPVCAIMIYVLFVFFVTNTDDCTFRSCALHEVMLFVAETQIDIENNISKNGIYIKSNNNSYKTPLSKYISSYSILNDGTISVRSGENELYFSPHIDEKKISWTCRGTPKSVFDSKYTNNIADCGKLYRNNRMADYDRTMGKK